jgi:phosphinothricin acetyltransferase
VADAAGVQAIYAPIVRDTAISFELEPPSVEEMAQRIAKTMDAGLPWLVLEHDGAVLGYVYAAKHRGDRPAYQWSVEVSVYIHESARGVGAGRALYTSLFSVLAFQHIQNAYAGATLPNPASVAIHESFGFRRVGIYEEVGYKLDRWHDTIWWVKRLGAHAVPAPAIVWLDEARNMDGFDEALRVGERLLK